MKRFLGNKKHLLFLLAPVLLGVAVLVLMVATKKPPARKAQVDQPTAVRVVEATASSFRPSALGYGTARPEKVWNIVAEVSGKVVEIHPNFKDGAFLEAQTVLLKIDPSEYELAVRRNEAQVALVKAQLKQLEQEQLNLEVNLKLEKRNLALVDRELKRQVALVGDGSISETIMEQVERDRVRSQIAVTQLENQLALLPSRSGQLQAQLDQARAAYDDAKRRLGQTEIRLDFAGRVAARRVELMQPVGIGASLGEVHGTNRVEIRAEISLAQMEALSIKGGTTGTDLSASVRLKGEGGDWVWPAEVRHIAASLDPATRAMGVMVVVEDPYQHENAQFQPALVNGMFCEVQLFGRERRGVLVPRLGLKGEQVAVVGQDQLLELRQVELGTVFGELAEVTRGISAGDQVIVSELVPVVEGRLLAPQPDDEIQKNMARALEGEKLP